MMNRLHEAGITGEALKHMIHTEDLLEYGSKAAQFGLSVLYDIYETLTTGKSSLRTTIKVDGSPSAVCASNFNGEKFVATKGFFAKDRKIARTPEDCHTYFGHAPDLERKMVKLLAALDEIQIPANEVWQGDFLFDSESLFKDTIDGEQCIAFHPNTIVYAIPVEDPLARRIAAADIGIVFHTRYRGASYDELKISFDVDATRLNRTEKAFCIDASLPALQLLDKTESENIYQALESITDAVTELEELGIMELTASNEELRLFLDTFQNSLIKSQGTQLSSDAEGYLDKLEAWVEARFDKEIATKKQPRTQAAYTTKKDQSIALLRSNREGLAKLIAAQTLIVAVKEKLITAINKSSSFRTLLKTIDKGYIPTGPEGYAVSDVEGNVAKLVSRLEFSKANFSKEVVKGWMSDSRVQESTTNLLEGVCPVCAGARTTIEDNEEIKCDYCKGLGFVERLNESDDMKEKLSVPELKQQIVSKAQQTQDPEALTRAYNALDTLSEDSIRAILAPRFVVPATLERVVKTVIRGRPGIENRDFLEILQKIVDQGVLPIPEDGERYNFIDAARDGAAQLVGESISVTDAISVVDNLIEDLLNDSFPQNGIVVGAGEILFALLMKDGSKRLVGDLTIGDQHVEVKGEAARLVGAADQGGLSGKPSQHGAKIRGLIKASISNTASLKLINDPPALNIGSEGPPALVEAFPYIENIQSFAEAYVDILMHVISKYPTPNPYRGPMIEAVVSQNWGELKTLYAMFHYSAYSYAAGWKQLLQFSGKNNHLVLTTSADGFRKAIEEEKISVSPFSFSPGNKGEGQELNGGFGLKVIAPGKGRGERAASITAKKQMAAAAKEAAKLEKDREAAEKKRLDNLAAIATKIGKAKDAIEAKKATLASISAPAKRAKLEASIAEAEAEIASMQKRLEGIS